MQQPQPGLKLRSNLPQLNQKAAQIFVEATTLPSGIARLRQAQALDYFSLPSATQRN